MHVAELPHMQRMVNIHVDCHVPCSFHNAFEFDLCILQFIELSILIKLCLRNTIEA